MIKVPKSLLKTQRSCLFISKTPEQITYFPKKVLTLRFSEQHLKRRNQITLTCHNLINGGLNYSSLDLQTKPAMFHANWIKHFHWKEICWWEHETYLHSALILFNVPWKKDVAPVWTMLQQEKVLCMTQQQFIPMTRKKWLFSSNFSTFFLQSLFLPLLVQHLVAWIKNAHN